MNEQDKINFWKEELKNKSIEEIGEQKFEVNDWGSCQYSGALAFYNTYFKMRKDLDMETTLTLLGIKIIYPNWKIRQFKDVKINLIKYHAERITDESCQNIDCVRLRNDIINDTCESESFDEYFVVLRNNAYDLWTATDEIFHIVFSPQLILENIPKTKGIGPSMNQIIQSENNYQTGLYCAIFVDLGLVKNPDCFKDFDT